MIYLLGFACAVLIPALAVSICWGSMHRSSRDYWLEAWDDRGDVLATQARDVVALVARAQEAETRLALKCGELADMTAKSCDLQGQLDSAAVVVDGLRGILEDFAAAAHDLGDEAEEVLAEVFGGEAGEDEDDDKCGDGGLDLCRCPSRN